MKKQHFHPASAALLGLLALLPGAARAQAPEQIQAPPRQAAAPKGRAPVAKDVLQVKLPRPQSFTLPGGGARMLVVEDHKLPLVTLTVSLRGGALFEEPAKPGVAGLTANLLTEGTTTSGWARRWTARRGRSGRRSAPAACPKTRTNSLACWPTSCSIRPSPPTGWRAPSSRRSPSAPSRKAARSS